MAIPETSTILILLTICVGMLFVAVLLIFQISARLSKLTIQVAQNTTRLEAATVIPPVAEVLSSGPFEAFLDEEPSRRKLIKSEQLSAYRLWRQQNGLNWSNS